MNPDEANLLLRAVDQKISFKHRSGDGCGEVPDHRRRSGVEENGQSGISGHALGIKLEDRELWGKFREHTNEMIVTKSGR